MSNIFYDIGIIIIFATAFGFLGRMLRQPLIPFYILAGLVIGPLGLGMIEDMEVIRTLSEIGVAFLLFVVGLELNLRKLKDVGNVVILGSIVQIVSMFLIGMGLGNWLGFGGKEMIYMGLILSFSSTMVVIKLLADKNELDTLHGRIVIGILLMEDLFAIIALSAVQTIGNFSAIILGESILKVVALLLITFLCAQYVFPWIFKFSAKSQEILFLVAITVCFSFGMLSLFLGMSIAIGSFVAGVALANLPYNHEIESKVRSLRDFFSTIFFVALGMELVLGNFTQWIWPLIVLVTVIIFVKPVLITSILSLFGYKKKTTFMTSTTLAQTSEFSLIIVTQGALMGHLGANFLSMTTLLSILTITISTYFIKFDDAFYQKSSRGLNLFEHLSKKNKEPEFMDEDRPYKAVLIGYDRVGYSIAKTLEKLGKPFLVVDYNPDIIKKLMKKNIPCIYGDAADIEIIKKLRFEQVDMIISTITDDNAAKLLIKKIKEENSHAMIIVSTLHIEEALDLYDEGADYVIIPHLLSGNHVSLMLESVSYDLDKLIHNKLSHIKELRDRKDLSQ